MIYKAKTGDSAKNWGLNDPLCKHNSRINF